MDATPDRTGRTPLHYAAMEGTVADVEGLLQRGLDPNTADRQGFTPLHFAAMHGRPDTARALVDAGAAVDAPDGWGNTPLGRALFEDKKRAEMVTLLRDRGADPYRENNYGASPISTAYLVAGDELRNLFSDLPAPEPRVQ